MEIRKCERSSPWAAKEAHADPQPGITAALWGARHPAELEAVAGALDWNLGADTRATKGTWLP